MRGKRIKRVGSPVIEARHRAADAMSSASLGRRAVGFAHWNRYRDREMLSLEVKFGNIAKMLHRDAWKPATWRRSQGQIATLVAGVLEQGKRTSPEQTRQPAAERV